MTDFLNSTRGYRAALISGHNNDEVQCKYCTKTLWGTNTTLLSKYTLLRNHMEDEHLDILLKWARSAHVALLMSQSRGEAPEIGENHEREARDYYQRVHKVAMERACKDIEAFRIAWDQDLVEFLFPEVIQG